MSHAWSVNRVLSGAAHAFGRNGRNVGIAGRRGQRPRLGSKSHGVDLAALGGFLNVTNVKSEKGVGVASFGGGGILGPNEYTLQLDTNANATTSVCAGHSGCTVWQQYLYATDFVTKGKAAVFIEYWLSIGGKPPVPKDWQVGNLVL